jgi:hypothetical protein
MTDYLVCLNGVAAFATGILGQPPVFSESAAASGQLNFVD